MTVEPVVADKPALVPSGVTVEPVVADKLGLVPSGVTVGELRPIQSDALIPIETMVSEAFHRLDEAQNANHAPNVVHEVKSVDAQKVESSALQQQVINYVVQPGKIVDAVKEVITTVQEVVPVIPPQGSLDTHVIQPVETRSIPDKAVDIPAQSHELLIHAISNAPLLPIASQSPAVSPLHLEAPLPPKQVVENIEKLEKLTGLVERAQLLKERIDIRGQQFMLANICSVDTSTSDVNNESSIMTDSNISDLIVVSAAVSPEKLVTGSESRPSKVIDAHHHHQISTIESIGISSFSAFTKESRVRAKKQHAAFSIQTFFRRYVLQKLGPPGNLKSSPIHEVKSVEIPEILPIAETTHATDPMLVPDPPSEAKETIKFEPATTSGATQTKTASTPEHPKLNLTKDVVPPLIEEDPFETLIMQPRIDEYSLFNVFSRKLETKSATFPWLDDTGSRASLLSSSKVDAVEEKPETVVKNSVTEEVIATGKLSTTDLLKTISRPESRDVSFRDDIVEDVAPLHEDDLSSLHSFKEVKQPEHIDTAVIDHSDPKIKEDITEEIIEISEDISVVKEAIPQSISEDIYSESFESASFATSKGHNRKANMIGHPLSYAISETEISERSVTPKPSEYPKAAETPKSKEPQPSVPIIKEAPQPQTKESFGRHHTDTKQDLMDNTTGRLTPNSLSRKLESELQLLLSMHETHVQFSELDKNRAIARTQQESVILAQMLVERQRTHNADLEMAQKARETANLQPKNNSAAELSPGNKPADAYYDDTFDSISEFASAAPVERKHPTKLMEDPISEEDKILDPFEDSYSSANASNEDFLDKRTRDISQTARSNVSMIRQQVNMYGNQRDRANDPPSWTFELERAILKKFASDKAEIERLKKLNMHDKLTNEGRGGKARQSPKVKSKTLSVDEDDDIRDGLNYDSAARNRQDDISESISEHISQSGSENVVKKEENPKPIVLPDGTTRDHSRVSSDSFEELFDKLTTARKATNFQHLEQKQKRLEISRSIADGILQKKKEMDQWESRLKKEQERISMLLDEAFKPPKTPSRTALAPSSRTLDEQSLLLQKATSEKDAKDDISFNKKQHRDKYVKPALEEDSIAEDIPEAIEASQIESIPTEIDASEHQKSESIHESFADDFSASESRKYTESFENLTSRQQSPIMPKSLIQSNTSKAEYTDTGPNIAYKYSLDSFDSLGKPLEKQPTPSQSTSVSIMSARNTDEIKAKILSTTHDPELDEMQKRIKALKEQVNSRKDAVQTLTLRRQELEAEKLRDTEVILRKQLEALDMIAKEAELDIEKVALDKEKLKPKKHVDDKPKTSEKTVPVDYSATLPLKSHVQVVSHAAQANQHDEDSFIDEQIDLPLDEVRLETNVPVPPPISTVLEIELQETSPSATMKQNNDVQEKEKASGASITKPLQTTTTVEIKPKSSSEPAQQYREVSIDYDDDSFASIDSDAVSTVATKALNVASLVADPPASSEVSPISNKELPPLPTKETVEEGTVGEVTSVEKSKSAERSAADFYSNGLVDLITNSLLESVCADSLRVVDAWVSSGRKAVNTSSAASTRTRSKPPLSLDLTAISSSPYNQDSKQKESDRLDTPITKTGIPKLDSVNYAQEALDILLSFIRPQPTAFASPHQLDETIWSNIIVPLSPEAKQEAYMLVFEAINETLYDQFELHRQYEHPLRPFFKKRMFKPKPIPHSQLLEATRSSVQSFISYSETHGENLDALLIQQVKESEKLWRSLDVYETAIETRLNDLIWNDLLSDTVHAIDAISN